MKEKLEQIKEFVGKLSSKTKKLIIAGAALLLIAAVGPPDCPAIRFFFDILITPGCCFFIL